MNCSRRLAVTPPLEAKWQNNQQGGRRGVFIFHWWNGNQKINPPAAITAIPTQSSTFQFCCLVKVMSCSSNHSTSKIDQTIRNQALMKPHAMAVVRYKMVVLGSHSANFSHGGTSTLPMNERWAQALTQSLHCSYHITFWLEIASSWLEIASSDLEIASCWLEIASCWLENARRVRSSSCSMRQRSKLFLSTNSYISYLKTIFQSSCSMPTCSRREAVSAASASSLSTLTLLRGHASRLLFSLSFTCSLVRALFLELLSGLDLLSCTNAIAMPARTRKAKQQCTVTVYRCCKLSAEAKLS